MKKKTIYKIEGLENVAFEDLEKASALFKLLHEAKPIKLNVKWIEPVKKSKGYNPSDPFYYDDGEKEIKLTSKTLEIHTYSEIKEIAKNREEAKKKLLTNQDKATKFLKEAVDKPEEIPF